MRSLGQEHVDRSANGVATNLPAIPAKRETTDTIEECHLELRDIFPVGFEQRRRAGSVSLVTFSAERFRSLPFHDRRFLLPVGEVDWDEIAGAVAAPPHLHARYIFHTGFCSSTLLSRLLDCPGVTFCLREPSILTDLSRIPASRGDLPGFSGILSGVHTLLSRGEFDTETPVIKTHNACLAILDGLIAANVLSTRGTLMLYSSIEDFMAAVLRDPKRRRWVRFQVGEWKWQTLTGIELDIERRTDAEMAALCWSLHMGSHYLAARSNGVNIPTLRDEDLHRDIEAYLRAVIGLLGLPMTSTQLENALRGPVLARHSKDGIPYNRRTREEVRQWSQTRYADEIRDGMRWFERASGLAALLEWPPRELQLNPG